MIVEHITVKMIREFDAPRTVCLRSFLSYLPGVIMNFGTVSRLHTEYAKKGENLQSPLLKAAEIMSSVNISCEMMRII